MPNLIFKVKNYTNEDVIEKLVDYIMSSLYLENYGMRGCFITPNQNIAESVSASFHAAKNIYDKANGQLVQHIIVGFGDMNVSEEQVCMVACAISNYFFVRGYQLFWGSHWGSERSDSYRHIHIALNNVNVMTGERFSASYDNMGKLKDCLVKLFPGGPWNYFTDESFYHENT